MIELQFTVPAKGIYVDSCGRKGLGETPQRAKRVRRLISRPR